MSNSGIKVCLGMEYILMERTFYFGSCEARCVICKQDIRKIGLTEEETLRPLHV